MDKNQHSVVYSNSNTCEPVLSAQLVLNSDSLLEQQPVSYPVSSTENMPTHYSCTDFQPVDGKTVQREFPKVKFTPRMVVYEASA